MQSPKMLKVALLAASVAALAGTSTVASAMSSSAPLNGDGQVEVIKPPPPPAPTPPTQPMGEVPAPDDPSLVIAPPPPPGPPTTPQATQPTGDADSDAEVNKVAKKPLMPKVPDGQH